MGSFLSESHFNICGSPLKESRIKKIDASFCRSPKCLMSKWTAISDWPFVGWLRHIELKPCIGGILGFFLFWMASSFWGFLRLVGLLFTLDSLAIEVACEVVVMVRRGELYDLDSLVFLMYLALAIRCRQFANRFWLTLQKREKLFIEKKRRE